MKYFSLLLSLMLSTVAGAQTPTVKWTVTRNTLYNWIQLDGQWYPYYIDSTKFVLFNQTTSSTLSPKFSTLFPTGFPTNASDIAIERIPDVNGDGKDDISLDGYSASDVYIDGSNGSIIYQFPNEPYGYPGFISDVDGDGHNEIVWFIEGTNTSLPYWIVYATNGISTGAAGAAQYGASNFKLNQNYPNPFNPSTTITYSLSTSVHVSLRVYDIMGREVKNLIDERQNAGNHSVNLNVSGLSSGTYFYQLQAGSAVQDKKLLIVK